MLSDIEEKLALGKTLTRDEQWALLGEAANARAEIATLRTALAAQQEALRDANASWSFSDGQAHTHTWHDKADWMERNRGALASLTTPSASRESEVRDVE